MIIEIIGWVVIATFILACVYCYKKSKNPETYQDTLFMAVSIMTGIISAIFLLVVLINSFHDNTDKSEFSIVSLERQNEIYGSFFLGTGTIEEITYYYVYRKTSIGLVFEKIPVNKFGYRVYIVETNDISPRFVDETYCEEDPGFLNWNQECKHTKKLIVPKGTVVREFKA